MEDFTALYNLEGLSESERAHIRYAISDALSAPKGLNVSNDTTDSSLIAYKKVNLDFVKETLIPERYRARAEGIIDTYMTNIQNDPNSMLSSLYRSAAKTMKDFDEAVSQEFEQEATQIFQGTRRIQKDTSEFLGYSEQIQYGSPDLLRATFEEWFTHVLDTLKHPIQSWPRDQRAGYAYVEQQLASFREDWNDFIQGSSRDNAFKLSTRYLSTHDYRV